MGYSEIVPGSSYDEPAMRAGVQRLLTERERLVLGQRSALPLLAAAVTLDVLAVLASPFDVNTASSYGVIICEGAGPVQRMLGLVEKPGRPEACRLLAEHAPAPCGSCRAACTSHGTC
ncbi:hypothetical protein SHKM778_60430 [Streptomyces sp. KM77-8]|uniref:Uncharacterized protein n=1 Tax=Streptomyces haneummycinicus TaxID=3074435 RepID=A0AAT9HR48_9ACTN